jgi:hypothetical protein
MRRGRFTQTFNEQQKNRFADMLFGGDPERDNRRIDRTSD